MIVFVGSEDRGYFLREVAAIKKMNVGYIDGNPSITAQLNTILEHQMRYLVFDVEQYTDAGSIIAIEIERIRRAKNCEVIIYAPGYDSDSMVIRELQKQGIKYYILSPTQAGAKEEMERCLNGYYIEPVTETEPMEETEERVLPKKIGITGVCRRMGTTTIAIQLVKYLQLKGHKACYVEVNDTGFVREHGEYFVSEHDDYLGRVTYENVDMYYKQEHLQEVLHRDYEYYIFDYGAYSERGFNKTSFLEKDLRVFVSGSKANELEFTKGVIKNEYYTEVKYLFNFISEKEKPDLLEYMEEKAADTYFSVYAPDQFEYVHNSDFERLLPVEDIIVPSKKEEDIFPEGKGG